MILRKVRFLMLLDLNPDERKSIALASLSSISVIFDFISFSFMSLYIDKSILVNTKVSNWSSFILFSIFLLGYMFRPLGMYLYCKFRQKNDTPILSIYTFLQIGTYLAIGLMPFRELFSYKCLIILIIARVIHGIAGGVEIQAQYTNLAIKLAD